VKTDDSMREVRPEDLRAARRMYIITSWKGRRYIRKWPKARGQPKSDGSRAWMDQFGCLGFLTKAPDPRLYDLSKRLANGTGFLPRDVIAAAANGHMFFSATGIKITTPTADVYRSTGQIFTPNTVNKLTPNSVYWDTNQFWNSVTNPTRLTCKSSGLYFIHWGVEYEAKAGEWAYFTQLVLNGVDQAAEVGRGVAGGGGYSSGQLLWYFEQGDYMELKSYYNPTSRNTYLRHFQIVGITPETIV